ncbi:MAG: ABC transporter ATP-binding protein [Christensenellales bacterium]|jgi:ATP-binding cassette subfamily B multidrug efflux pump|nr:ABC transporter ATP-binding protein [Clostridiales bacterium]
MRNKNTNMTKTPMQTLSRLLRDLKPFRFQLIIILAANIINVVASVFAALQMRKILENIFEQADIGTADATQIASLAWVLIAFFVITILTRFIMSRLLMNVSVGTMKNIRVKMYNHMLTLPIKYFDENKTGDIMSRYTNDVSTLRHMISTAFPELVTSILNVITAITTMLIISPLLSISSVLMLAVMLVIVLVMSSKVRKYFRAQQAEIGQTNAYAEEYIEGQKVVRVFCHEDKVSEKFSEINSRYARASYKAETISISLYPLIGNLSYFTYTLIAVFGALLISKGYLGSFAAATATLITFLQLSSQLSRPLVNASNQYNSVLTGLAGAERIYNLIGQKPEKDEGDIRLVNIILDEDGKITTCDKCTKKWAWQKPLANGEFEYTLLKGDVRFYGVRFCYEENQPVLNRIDLYAKPEQKIAFVGSTGAGKTTITNLINRFYDIPFGSIKYDGIDIKDIRKDDLRRSLAMVLQDTHLFEGTIKDNIKYGKLEASDEEVYEAAKLANADEFIQMLPDGYETMISATSDNLSQGQRQMISIARAAIADAPVVILDEATSSIDTRTEKLIQASMDRLMHGRTTFVIAHRLSTIKNADAIIVLENGEIIERGNHDNLIKQKGRYYRLYTGKEELK